MTPSVRILFVTGEYPPMIGGVGDYTANLRAALNEVGVRSAVVSGGQASGAEVFHVPNWGFRSMRVVASHARLVQADIVHIQYQAGAFGMHPAVNLIPEYLRRSLNRPVVTTFHDLLPPFLFPKAGSLRSAVVALCSPLTSCSRAASQVKKVPEGTSDSP